MVSINNKSTWVEDGLGSKVGIEIALRVWVTSPFILVGSNCWCHHQPIKKEVGQIKDMWVQTLMPNIKGWWNANCFRFIVK